MPCLLAPVVETWLAVRAASGRLEKRRLMAALFAPLEPVDLRLAATYLAGELPQATTGVGWALLNEATRGLGAQGGPPLALVDVDAAFAVLAASEGAGANRRRNEALAALFGRATDGERELLTGLLLGELRQGALRALVIEALAAARHLDAGELRRAVNNAGALGTVAEAIAREGEDSLARFTLRPLTPIEPMLAATAGDLAAAIVDLGGEVAVEWKLDGVRVQLHRQGDEVRVFTRSLRDVTGASPELVAFARGLGSSSFVLDGEVVSLRDDGKPVPFQDLMSKFSTEDVVPAASPVGVRLEAFFFDLLYVDDAVLVERPDRERRAALEALVGPARCIPRRVVRGVDEARAALEEAIDHGHEGVMLKALDAPYAAGRRGGLWRKVKPTHTVDLVILAAEWGHGRRVGLLSNLHLGARDAADPERFWMLGKTFKGLTDAMLREMTADLSTIAVERDAHVVRVRPERVVEIAFDDVLRSTRYDSGFALRFARVKRFRPDKQPVEATTLEEIRGMAGRKGETGRG